MITILVTVLWFTARQFYVWWWEVWHSAVSTKNTQEKYISSKGRSYYNQERS